MKSLYSQPAAGNVRILQLPAPQMYGCHICGVLVASTTVPLINGHAVCPGCVSDYQQKEITK